MSRSSSLKEVTTGISHKGCSLLPCQSQTNKSQELQIPFKLQFSTEDKLWFLKMPNRIWMECRESHMSDLQVVLTEFYEALDEVILGFSQKLLDSLAPFGQGEVAVPKVAQDASEVLPTAVDQDPAWTFTRGPRWGCVQLKTQQTPLNNI